jgi:hypothetical protein
LTIPIYHDTIEVMEEVSMPDDNNSQEGSKPAAVADTTGTTPVKPAVSEDASKVTAKMVPESDLLAVKSGKESLEKRLSEVETTYKTKLSDTETKLYSTEAKVKQLEEQLSQANLTVSQAAVLKQQLDAATKKTEELTGKSLEYRRRIVASTYNVPVETVNNKSMEQLDYYEEALKALQGSRGNSAGGGYAGGGTGGGAAPESNLDRAKRIIADHEHRVGAMKVTTSGAK